MSERMICGIYVRVSTEEQAREGFSINAQKEKLKQYALVRDWDIYDIYIDDGISGKNLVDRPEVLRLIQDVEDGKINTVLVYKIDRLTRSMKNLLELLDLFQKKDCNFNSFTEAIDTSSATGRMFLKIVGIFAEFERENLGERVAFGCEQKAREGYYSPSSPVYGYDHIKGRELTVNEYEKKVINDMFHWYLDSMPQSKIAKRLRDSNIPTKTGGRWTQTTIRNMLTNSLYIGKVRYRVNQTKAECEFEVDAKNVTPIVPKEIFNNVQLILNQRRLKQTKKYASENAFFAGSLYCINCGKRMTPLQHRDKNTKSKNLYVGYACPNRYDCKSKGFSQRKLEKAFLEYIKGFCFEINEEVMQVKKDTFKEQNPLTLLEKELAKVDNKKKQVRELFLQDKLTIEDYRSMLDELNTRSTPIQEKIQSLAAENEIEEVSNPRETLRIINHLKLNWEFMENKDKVLFLHKFVKGIKAENFDGTIYIRELIFYDLDY